jgi:DNA repair protein RadD
MITPFQYQTKAALSFPEYFVNNDGNPLCVIPTAGGKSVVIALFLKWIFEQWPDQRVLLLTHVRELISQDYDELLRLWPEAPVGIDSAGLKQREYGSKIIFGGIQSLHRNAHRLPRIDLVIIDEAHLVPRTANTMYRKFLRQLQRLNPFLKVIGLTATPFRLDSGMLHEGDDALFTDICFEIGIRELIDLGRLVPPVSLAARTQIDTSGVGTRGGEFIAGQLEAAALDPEVVARIADEIVKHGADRQGWLVFCCGVAHGEALDEALRERDVASAAIFGETKSDERDRIITMFKAGELRALCSVGVLTTGFNATHVDLVALARATKSTGLFIQMVGRGLRVHPGKVDCRILDFGGNIERHGPVDVPRVRSKSTTNGEGEAPFKICPECGQAHPTAQRECECGYAFPPPERRIHITASTAEPLATKAPPEWIEVERVTYRRHHKPGKVPSLRVDYHAGLISYPEWICLEHTEYPRSKAVGWWCRRGPELPVPDTVDEALRLVSALREPTHILVRRVGPYDEIVGTRL